MMSKMPPAALGCSSTYRRCGGPSSARGPLGAPACLLLLALASAVLLLEAPGCSAAVAAQQQMLQEDRPCDHFSTAAAAGGCAGGLTNENGVLPVRAIACCAVVAADRRWVPESASRPADLFLLSDTQKRLSATVSAPANQQQAAASLAKQQQLATTQQHHDVCLVLRLLGPRGAATELPPPGARRIAQRHC